MRFINSTLKFLFIITIFAGTGLMAQNQNKPCNMEEASQFDFWIGEWNLTWTGPNGEIQQGTNKITKILDGCVIEENFDGAPSIPLKGRSISTYSPQKKAWIQIWVDNQGGYLDFTGDYVRGEMILSRETTLNGSPLFQRMVWYNITEDELDWNWEKSNDGITWELSWKIHYKRKL